MDNSEKDLLKACFQGDRKAWDDFVDQYSKLVYYSIHQTFKIKGLASDSSEADDLYGAVFLSLFENNFAKLRSFKGKNDCSLASWIRLIAANKTYDYLREKARREKFVELSGEDLPDTAAQLDAEGETLARERIEMAKDALKELNAEEASFLYLYYEKELSPEKIAELMGITVSTVYSKKNRVREKLKGVIERKTRVNGR